MKGPNIRVSGRVRTHVYIPGGQDTTIDAAALGLFLRLGFEAGRVRVKLR